MRELLQVQGMTKTFRLSAKQQKLEKTREKVRTAVDHLSFTAYEGEIFGLLGPNGAGKTTTLRLLATLIRPDSGDAMVDGASVVREPDEVRGRIGFLTSELKLEDCFTPNYLFIFDEPTNGLDVLTAKVVTDFLQQLREEGKTIIVSTHIFSLIEKLCDRVGIIISGKMIVCDTLDRVCGGMNLEDRFFDIYRETVGEAE